MPLPIPAAPVRIAAQPLFTMPTPRADERLRNPAKPKRRKASAKRGRNAGKARKAKTTGTDDCLAAIALPRHEEPLVSAASPPARPGALALIRPAGLLGQIGLWLNARSGIMRDRLAGLRKAPATNAELRRLRAENARLRAQLDAFLALRQTTSPSKPDRTPLPLP